MDRLRDRPRTRGRQRTKLDPYEALSVFVTDMYVYEGVLFHRKYGANFLPRPWCRDRELPRHGAWRRGHRGELPEWGNERVPGGTRMLSLEIGEGVYDGSSFERAVPTPPRSVQAFS